MFYDEISTDTKMVPMSLEESKKDMLKILKKFEVICKRLNLRYWLLYGTLIGAIRHKGFIPWDDDLDVGMPREDYNKLLNYFANNENSVDSLYIDNYRFDKTCFFYISRLCDKEHVLEFPLKNHKSGLFIDIYPLDGMGNDEDKNYWIQNWEHIHSIQKRLEMSCFKSFFTGKNNLHKLINFPLNLYTKIRGRGYYLNLIDLVSRKFDWNSSTYVGIPAWAGSVRFERREWYDRSIKVPFEDMMITVPSDYDKILTTIYGDYMKLPPEKDRHPTHDYKAYKMED